MTSPSSQPRSLPPDWVTAGLLLNFASRAGPGLREDVLNSTLLAQLAADKKASRFTGQFGWSETEERTLGNLSWVTSLFSKQRIAPPAAPFTVLELVERKLEDFRRGDAIGLARALVARFNALGPGAPARTLFESFTQSSTAAQHEIAMELGFVDAQSGLFTVGLAFATEQPVGSALSATFDPLALDGMISVWVHAADLNEFAYGGMRAEVIAKLGDRRKECIAALDEEVPDPEPEKEPAPDPDPLGEA